MRRLALLAVVAFVIAAPAASAADSDLPIPQDPGKQEQQFRDLLEWNRKTFGGAYEAAGKKGAGWDKPAGEALDAAARLFGRAIDPQAKEEEVYAAAKRAVDAGCDDPLILYLHARFTVVPNDPGPAESKRRWAAAAKAMEQADYPPLRRAVALSKAGMALAKAEDPTAEEKEEASRRFDAALALVPHAADKSEAPVEAQDEWFAATREIIEGQRLLTGDYKVAFERADKVLAKAPGLKVLRLQAKGDYLIRHAWEARGIGMGRTVTPDAGRQFGVRLVEAYKALDQAWKLKPRGTRTPGLMLVVLKGLGGERAMMEEWFRRAIEADGNNANACEVKMDWIDPKWHGTPEDVLAFGRACRATKNWRAGITLQQADSYLRASYFLPPGERAKYLPSKEVWDDIRAVYEEYLGHYPEDYVRRSMYAAYCCMCQRYAESDKQFKMVGDRLTANRFIHMDMMQSFRVSAANMAKAAPEPRP